MKHQYIKKREKKKRDTNKRWKRTKKENIHQRGRRKPRLELRGL
jgi:hypothetical protein